MIRVLVELWPDGDVEQASVLGQMGIANVTPTADPATYAIAVVDGSGELECSHLVTGHRRTHGWTALVSQALAQATIDNSDEVEELTTKIATHLATRINDRSAPAIRGIAPAEPR
jgi:hypothetical protein